MIEPFVALALALAVAPTPLGTPYPGARVDSVTHQKCSSASRLVSPDPIDRIASFYKAQAAASGVRQIDDSGRRFANYRTLTFSSPPRFLFVLLSRTGAQTTAQITYHPDEPSSCRD